MTTSIVSSTINQLTNEGFRAWTKQVSDQLQAIGLVKTADTGQINFETVTRTDFAGQWYGYEIFRFNDALQATRPIFMKVEYGSGPSASSPDMRVTIGSGTNGAGVIISNGYIAANFDRQSVMGKSSNYSQPSSATLSVPSYACFSEAAGGFFFAGWAGVSTWASNANNAAQFAWGVFRTVDDAGVPTGDGIVFYRQTANVVTATSNSFLTTFGSNGQTYCCIPGQPASTAMGADLQVYRHFVGVPQVRNVAGVATYVRGEIGAQAVVSVPLVGSARSYRALGTNVIGGSIHTNANDGHSLLMIWE